MSEHSAEPIQTEVPEDVPATEPIITPDTPPTEVDPTDPAPTPEEDDEPVVDPTEPVPSAEPTEPEVDPSEDTGKEPPLEEPVVEPSPEPETPERDVPEGDKPVESIPVGSVFERAVTYVSKIVDEDVRLLMMGALADRKIFSKDEDLRHRMEVSDNLREMIRWIRTNVPGSASYKTFMEAVNRYLLRVESEGIPTMWSAEAASAPLDELQARKAAMAIERAAAELGLTQDSVHVEDLRAYAQAVREGKIK